MTHEFTDPIVIDNGSGMCKAGIGGGRSMPSVVFPNIIGRPRLMSVMQWTETNEYLIGNDAHSKRGLLTLSYPVDHGVITNWDDMQLVWTHCFLNELRIDPSKKAVMLTEPPLNPRNNREKMMEVFFESFGVQGFYVGMQAVLALYSTGELTGVVFDSGDGVTHIVPVFEGYALCDSIPRVDIAGRDITEHLIKLLTERGIFMRTTAEKEVTREIKEKLCYVALDYEKELEESFKSSHIEKNYELPDGQSITIGNERFRAPEVLFQPSLIGLDVQGVHESADWSIKRCDLDIRKALYSNIFLSGGSTMYPGISERLTKELASRAPSSVKVRVRASPDRKFSVWIGGSILSSLPSFQQSWVLREEYEEYGSRIVHRKCF